MTTLLLATLFLPLFPSSMVFNWISTRLNFPYARSLLILIWPQIGILIIGQSAQQVLPGFIVWAFASALFYALRLLTVRELGLWASFIASSGLALTWTIAGTASIPDMQLFAFWFSLPAALLALLAAPLAKRFGAAFAGLSGDLTSCVPRLSAILAITILAAIATPPSPGFFSLLGLVNKLDWAIAAGILLIWLLWGWAATKLIQGFLTGEDNKQGATDISRTAVVLYACLMCIFIFSGFIFNGGML